VSAGRGRVVREVLSALARLDGDERYILYCREPADLALDDRFTWRRVRRRDPLWHLVVARAATRECDAFLSTNSYLTTWATRCPAAVIVYDLVPFVAGARAQKRAALIERATIDVGVRRAAAVICISAATRRDLIARVPSAERRAVVVPLAADELFGAPNARQQAPAVAARHGIARPYVLGVGTLEPRKNLSRLIDAWEQLPTHVRDAHELVLVGPTGWEADEILTRTQDHAVRTIGYVSDADLAALYAGSELFAYPSLYEGFGLPIVEAMAAGAPVLTSNISSLPEVAGDAGVLVDPRSVPAIRDALSQLLEDAPRRAALRSAGRARAAVFSWEHTATRLRSVLRAIS
jgi:glycosyltransferase involved in cell wall biosynthesis